MRISGPRPAFGDGHGRDETGLVDVARAHEHLELPVAGERDLGRVGRPVALPEVDEVEVDGSQVLFGKAQVGRDLSGTTTGSPLGVLR